jgi:tetratricopeptide (TPR) repeat protein
LGPEDEEEVRKVKVGLYSNVALCYFKMGNVSRVFLVVVVGACRGLWSFAEMYYVALLSFCYHSVHSPTIHPRTPHTHRYTQTQLDATVRNCDEALKLDANNAKVLYRRASAYEAKKDFEAAEADLKQAAQLAPEDKAVAALAARVQAQIKRQLEKEKKMWSKAFA